MLNSRVRKHSMESKKKISEAKKGKPSGKKGCHLSEEHKRRISDAKKGQIPWNKGKSPGEFTKKKISESVKAYWVEKNNVVNTNQ